MNKHWISSLVVASVILLASWMTPQEPVQDRNPNGSSELSLLMRRMEKQLVDARPGVLEGKLNDRNYPTEIDKINTAKPTDAETKTEAFPVFADIYLKSVKSFLASKPEELTENYNNVVNTCLACHSQHCPWPVSRIRKLAIKE
ncbi:MAG: hypothetical protein KBA16_02615 [Bacteroidia bacterium]|nr:hypothetical protein [Bacteroidia bacterium]